MDTFWFLVVQEAGKQLLPCLQRIQAGMEPGQSVLFLSFSRAAVARILEAG